MIFCLDFQQYEEGFIGIHWSELDEDLSNEGFFSKDILEGKSELYTLFKAFPEIINELHSLEKALLEVG